MSCEHCTSKVIELILRKENIDSMFAKSVIDSIFGVCKLFGPNAVLFMSNDDKTKILLGLAGAILQAPLLVHIKYKLKMLDHDFISGKQHRLIQSVYGICEITNIGGVLYSGNIFIRIRSGKHDSSNAYTHAFDVREMIQSMSVKERPILLMETDRPWMDGFPKTLATAVNLFRLLDLDVLLLGVNAAGLSAFNPV